MENKILLQIGSVSVTGYSVCVCVAAMMFSLLVLLRAKKHQIKQETAEWFTLFSLLLGIFCGHFLYCLSLIYQILPDPEEGIAAFFMPWKGNFMMFGVIGGCVVSAWLAGKITGERMSRILDFSALPICIFIACVRFASPLCGQGYGSEVSEEFLHFFPLSYVPDPEYEDELYFAVFIYEGLAALAIGLIISLLKQKPAGFKAAYALIFYSASQIFFESIREDQLVEWLFVRVSQIYATLIMLGILIFCLVKAGQKEAYVRNLVLYLVLVAACVFFEFIKDKPAVLGMYIELDNVYCHSAMFVLAACMGVVSSRSLRRLGQDGIIF